jgi:hypothetical protein
MDGRQKAPSDKEARNLGAKSDYIDFKALGYKGDPIETGGRFTKLLFWEKRSTP